ncbi:MAG: phosphatase PAP2 family protein [Alphaproteobacteria bacterium]|nr:phosphatase PAP2 family protein [Alphaproteobacteria bacterium]
MKLHHLLFMSFLFISQNTYAISYLTEKEIPDIVSFLPLPPKEDTKEFISDKQQYELGKTLRNTKRGQIAIEDASHEVSYIAQIYSEVSGITLTQETTPHTLQLLSNILDTTAITSTIAKKHHFRTRPFAYFNEPTPIPDLEKKYRTRNSYPSGHTLIGWTTALVMAQLLPSHQTEILKRGYEYGQSRVIVGYHYQTDVSTSRLLAGSLVNALNQSPRFKEDLNKAKQEIQKQKNSLNQ